MRPNVFHWFYTAIIQSFSFMAIYVRKNEANLVLRKRLLFPGFDLFLLSNASGPYIRGRKTLLLAYTISYEKLLYKKLVLGQPNG